jgi:hypothetical protein
MSTGHVDPTIKTAVLANTVFDAVLDAAAINAYYDDLGNKIDGNYDEAHADNAASLGLYRKGVINGGMMVAQRGTSFTIATATSAYTVDRMKSVNLGSGVSAVANQLGVTDLNGASKGFGIVHSGIPTNQGKLSHVYTMEAPDAYALAGQQVTFQVQVKSLASMNRVTLNARYKTTESAISNTSTLIGASSATAIGAGWTLVTLTVTLPSRATLTATGVIGIEIIGSKTTAEAINDGFIITSLDWNIGSTALPFQPRSFAEELALCQRYYEKSYSYATAPATSTSAGMESKVLSSNTIATNQIYGKVNYKTIKRIVPTVTIYPFTTPANTGRVSDTNLTDLAANSGAITTPGDSGFGVVNTGGSITTSNTTVLFQWSSDAEL